MQDLKLLAMDGDDLAVISAHLQDAVVKVGEMGYVPRAQRFALLLNRFDWDQKVIADECVRRRAGLHFERVRAVKTRGFSPERADQVLNLLAVTFVPTEEPSGHVLLTFSGGAEILLDVECIEARLGDLGPTWACAHAPEHGGEIA